MSRALKQEVLVGSGYDERPCSQYGDIVCFIMQVIALRAEYDKIFRLLPEQAARNVHRTAAGSMPRRCAQRRHRLNATAPKKSARAIRRTG